MSSANEEMHPPPSQQKARVSPLEFRNTDLVSRLLAATPPYLYNMPLVPHTYFFSEMLRSFVQAKGENNSCNSNRTQSHLTSSTAGGQHHQRRTRKRSWTNAVQHYHNTKQVEHQLSSHKFQEAALLKEMPPPVSCAPQNWTPKMYLDKTTHQHLNIFDKPLELTKHHAQASNKPDQNASHMDSSPKVSEASPLIAPATYSASAQPGPDSGVVDQGSMVLPPPPPLWYPPLYPPGASYGSTFDPLHFFIDLRVSGHIYDRKGVAKDEEPKEEPTPLGYFKQSRHCSAFSEPNNAKNIGLPMNLTSTKTSGDVKMKFDVKSMGFDKNNRTSTNYIMQNIDGIYKSINSSATEIDSLKDERKKESSDSENDEEKQKAKKDLRALIGLELVVDYMSSSKTQKKLLNSSSLEENVSSSKLEDELDTSSSRGCSPAVEVVAVNENENFVYN